MSYIQYLAQNIRTLTGNMKDTLTEAGDFPTSKLSYINEK